jgi:autotransporter-associated beta strand protein
MSGRPQFGSDENGVAHIRRRRQITRQSRKRIARLRQGRRATSWVGLAAESLESRALLAGMVSDPMPLATWGQMAEVENSSETPVPAISAEHVDHGGSVVPTTTLVLKRPPELEPTPASATQPRSDVVVQDRYTLETFDTAETTRANGWVGNTTAVGGHDFGWNSAAVAGVGTGGSAGGVFARSSGFSFFADTSIGQLSRTDTLRLSGTFRLHNVNFDGALYLGYFNPLALAAGRAPTSFLGIEFSEPTGPVTGAFRGRVVVTGEGGANSSVISLPQNTLLDFDLIWTGAADGSGTLSGTLAGQSVAVTASSGPGTFTAFGLLVGGLGSSNANEKTGQCLFDTMTYRKEASLEPGPSPELTPLSDSLEARAAWMIGTYRGVTIGGPSAPNGTTGQKFGWADVLARLALDPDDPVPIQRFVELMTTGNINGAFMPAGAGWILTKYWDRFTPFQRDSLILPRLKNLGNLLSHGTENHFLIRYAGAHLFAQLWPDEKGWYDTIQKKSISSAELSQITKDRLLTTLRSYYDKGYSEHLSPNYLPVHFYPLHALYTCATDPEVKAAANAALTYHVAEMAANFFGGATIAPYNRPAPQQISDPQKNTALNTHVKAVYWLYWAELMNTASTDTATFPSAGSTAAGGEAKHFAVATALSDWRPPALLTELARGDGILPFTLHSAAPNFGEFARGEPAHVSRTVYRDPRFAVGSGNFTTWIDNVIPGQGRGLSERAGFEIVYKTADVQNSIVVHHPYWRTNADQYKWLSQSSPFQQNVQREGTVISLFDIPQSDPFAGRTRSDWEAFRDENFDSLIQQAWIRYPKAADEVVEAGGWIMLREGETYVAIRPWNGYVRDTSEFSDMTVARSPGPRNAVIVDVATVDQFPTFAAFRNAVLAAPLTVDLAVPSVTYTNVKGDTITARFNVSDYSAKVIQSFPSATVNGVAQVMRDPDFVNARAVIKSDPLSVIGRVLTVNVPAGRMTVDWRNRMPAFQFEPAAAVFVVEAETEVDAQVHSGGTQVVKRGPGTLVLELANSHSGGTFVESGEVVVRNVAALGTGPLVIGPGARVTLEVGREAVPLSVLELDPTGRLEVGTGRVTVSPGGFDENLVRQALVAGRSGGAWNAPTGITSAAARGQWTVGYRVAGDGLTVAWAAVGDTDLDGSVNTADVNSLLTSGWLNTDGSSGRWQAGDFDYDGRVTTADVNQLLTSGLLNTGPYQPTVMKVQAASLAIDAQAAFVGPLEEAKQAAMDENEAPTDQQAPGFSRPKRVLERPPAILRDRLERFARLAASNALRPRHEDAGPGGIGTEQHRRRWS